MQEPKEEVKTQSPVKEEVKEEIKKEDKPKGGSFNKSLERIRDRKEQERIMREKKEKEK